MTSVCRYLYNDIEGSVKPGNVVRELYGYKLTPRERAEILKYEKVYYYGQNARNKMKGYRNRRKNKYKTNSGLYDYVLRDHLLYRYEILSEKGRGAFGSVLKVYDHKLKKNIAIKNVSVNIRDSHTEVTILRYLKSLGAKEYVVEIYDSFFFRGCIFIAFEILRSDLNKCIIWHRSIGIGFEMLSTIAFSLFKCLDFLHNKCNVLHCDLKPENILFVDHGKTSIKLADFGISCKFSEIEKHSITTTLYYRAPEVIFGGKITSAIDIWAAGCVLAEMFKGEVFFYGENVGDQLSLIMAVLGIPTPDFLDGCDEETVLKYIDEDDCPRHCRLKPNAEQVIELEAEPSPSGKIRHLPGTISLHDALTGITEPEYFFVDLLEKCLEWNPDKRVSAAQALSHHFFKRRVPTTQIEVGTLPQYTSPMLFIDSHGSDIEAYQKNNDSERCNTTAF